MGLLLKEAASRLLLSACNASQCISPSAAARRAMNSAAAAATSSLPASLAHLAPGQAQPDAPMYTPHLQSVSYVLAALEHVSINPQLVKAILNPDREVTVQLACKLDTGEVETFSGHLVQHNNVRGPFKGGFIMHQDVTLEGLRNLAVLNTWKTALMDVPFGGCKLGIAVDPRVLSVREQEKITRKFVTAVHMLLGPREAIPAPDIGTDERHMAWIFDQFSRINRFAPAVVSGKPTWLHGCQGRDTAAGRGAALMTCEFIRKVLKKRLAGTTFIIQGFGKNGSSLAEFLTEQGAKIIGVSSSETACYNQDGLDIKALKAHVAQGKYLAEFPGAQAIPNDDTFLEIPCDVVVPAAVDGTINAKTAPKLQCSAVVEASNAGITVEGNQVLAERGIPVCPDLAVNGGGVVVSFFEWVQNNSNSAWELEEVVRKQERYMTDAFTSMFNVARSRGVSLRTAAYIIALERIARTDANRGHG